MAANIETQIKAFLTRLSGVDAEANMAHARLEGRCVKRKLKLSG